jgi:hypothetical protein
MPPLDELILVTLPNLIGESTRRIRVVNVHAEHAITHRGHLKGRSNAVDERHFAVGETNEELVGGNDAPHGANDVRELLVWDAGLECEDLVCGDEGFKPFRRRWDDARRASPRAGTLVVIHYV